MLKHSTKHHSKSQMSEQLKNAILSPEPVEATPELLTEIWDVSKWRIIRLALLVTPALAKEWLESRNNCNRTVKDHRVEKLAQSFNMFGYVLTHQGAAFGNNGIQQDAQHRFLAIIESGLTCPMVITFGQSEEARKHIDDVWKRTIADNLKMEGKEERADRFVQVAKAMALMLHEGEVLSQEQVEVFRERWGEALRWAASLKKVRRLMPSLIAGTLALVYLKNSELAGQIADQLLNGNNLALHDPVLALRNFLLKSKGIGSAQVRYDAGRKALTAAHAVLEGRTIKRLEGSEASVDFFRPTNWQDGWLDTVNAAA